MPTRRLPNSNATRTNALVSGKERKDMIPAPPVIPYTTATATWLDTFLPPYLVKVNALDTSLQNQTSISAQVRETRFIAEMFISHFFQALQNAILRKTFLPDARSYYGIAVNDRKVPSLLSEADITFWNNKATTGEAARIADGGATITFPSIANVNTAVTNFKNANLLQANAKDLFDIAQEEVEVLNPEADRLILKMWNETETAFDTGNKPSMRRKAREWGVIYLPSPGEAISPDDFSITGKITDGVTGTAVSEGQITVVETGAIVLSQPNGDYFVPVLEAGAYTLLVEKTGYYPLTVPNVQVTAGNLTTKNIPMVSEANSGNTTVVQGSYLSPETVTADITGVNTTPASLISAEIFNSPAGIFASETNAGMPVGVRYDRPEGSIIHLLVEDFKALIGCSPTKQIIRVQNIGMVPGSYKFTFRNLE